MIILFLVKNFRVLGKTNLEGEGGQNRNISGGGGSKLKNCREGVTVGPNGESSDKMGVLVMLKF